MLHIRVVSPADVTGRLVDRLSTVSGVVNLVILPKAERRGGDAVQFDVLTGSANPVLRQLREFGLDRDTSVVIQTVDAAIMDLARRAARQRFYHGERAPVWELVEARIHEGTE